MQLEWGNCIKLNFGKAASSKRRWTWKPLSANTCICGSDKKLWVKQEIKKAELWMSGSYQMHSKGTITIKTLMSQTSPDKWKPGVPGRSNCMTTRQQAPLQGTRGSHREMIPTEDKLTFQSYNMYRKWFSLRNSLQEEKRARLDFQNVGIYSHKSNYIYNVNDIF